MVTVAGVLRRGFRPLSETMRLKVYSSFSSRSNEALKETKSTIHFCSEKENVHGEVRKTGFSLGVVATVLEFQSLL